VADRLLHIAVDGRELLGQPTGVGRFLLEILRVWAADRASAHTFTVILPADPPPHLTGLGPRIAWRVEPAVKAGTWWEQVRLPQALARLSPDVLLAPGYTTPLQRCCPAVVTIHDVSFWAHPEWFPRREGIRRRWLTRTSARRAARILTVSEFSAREIVKWLRVPASRVVVAAHGAPAVPAPAAQRPESRLVLFTGSLFTRRRIPELITAFRDVAARVPEARLVLAGDNRTQPKIDPPALAAAAGIGDRVEWRAYVSDEERDRLYATARVFVFLSDYEGFALTPLEAIAHGVPPVLLDTPVAREVYGDAARYVSADPAAIAGALTSLLQDDRAHQDLVAAGARRLPAFSWVRSAAIVLRTLEQAAAP
jgi:glycosyltransferase involved in cell wall biosynthesis